MSDELIARCRRGDAGAFEELVDSTHRQVYALAYRLVWDRHEAEDVAQEAYLRVFRALPGFRQDARFETWLYRIVTNTAFTQLKRRGRFGSVLAESQDETLPDSDDHPMERAIDRDELRQALGGLTVGLRTPVVLKDMYGLSVREIAEELGVSEATVKVRLHRARKRLRESMRRGREG